MTAPSSRETRPVRPLVVGLLGALVFAAVAGLRLTAQGPYYDELQYACPAFAWTGHRVELFAPVTLAGIPLMTMPYVAAVKAVPYGIAMAVSGTNFSLATWRCYGVLLAACGIVLLGTAATRRLSLASGALFTVLLVTDATLLLAARHDYGPAAFGFLLRATFIALWLRSLDRDPGRPRTAFLLALVAGLATYEKVVSVVLAVPLTAIVLADRERRRSRTVAALAGFALGVAPLVLANVLSAVRDGSPLILRSLGAGGPQPEIGALRHAAAYLSLGAGHQLRRFVLGVDWPLVATAVELVLAVAALALATRHLQRAEPGPHRRAGLVAVGSYLIIGVLLWLMPRVTWAHNWLVGTPFNALAIAVAVAVSSRSRSDRRPRALPFVVGAWLVVRLVFLGATAVDLGRGRTSSRFDPSLAAVAEFAAAHADDAVFVASTWGVATQIYCVAQGREGLVYEPFWHDDAGARVEALRNRLAGRTLYLVRLRVPLGVRPAATAAVESALEDPSAWRELPADRSLAGLAAVEVRAFEVNAAER